MESVATHLSSGGLSSFFFYEFQTGGEMEPDASVHYQGQGLNKPNPNVSLCVFSANQFVLSNSLFKRNDFVFPFN